VKALENRFCLSSIRVHQSHAEFSALVQIMIIGFGNGDPESLVTSIDQAADHSAFLLERPR
jgi:hypothetical protein